VRVDEVIKEDEQWCIAMEYIEGETLAHRVWHHGVLSESEALGYIQQIGAALTLIHNQGLLHRDIKPLNIMRRPVETVPGIAGYEAVLIDFGIAREFNPNITQTHTQSLSEGFAPIEQYDWRSKRGVYTDVYALAATLYALLTGEIPLPAPMRAYRLELEPPQQLNPKISDRVGWRMKGNWVSYNRLQFSPDAPVGELPALVVSDRFALRQQESVVSLLSRQDL